jgi:hypothetical protein
MREITYLFPINFDTAIASGANAYSVAKVDAPGNFICQSINGTLFTDQVYLTSTLAGTPYPGTASSSPGTTGNTLPTLALFRVMMEVNGINLFANPVRANLLFGSDGGSPHYFQRWPVFSPTADIKITLYNDTASTFGVKGQLLLEGFREIP